MINMDITRVEVIDDKPQIVACLTQSRRPALNKGLRSTKTI